MSKGIVAKASVVADAPIDEVWKALVTPETIKSYMFGSTVASDFRVGSPITWKGEWQGKAYEDKGEILKCEPERLLQYTHFSPLTGLPDKPENYHTVTIQLTARGEQTQVELAQDNNATEEERAHSQENWETMLDGLKKVVERQPSTVG
jgi:uncharacterized protein YndB with AHSA1/START domain